MNISRPEQRALHALAQGGRILVERDGRTKPASVTLVTRDGLILADCTLALFQRLRRRGFVESRAGSPYRISLDGRRAVRSQPDNR